MAKRQKSLHAKTTNLTSGKCGLMESLFIKNLDYAWTQQQQKLVVKFLWKHALEDRTKHGRSYILMVDQLNGLNSLLLNMKVCALILEVELPTQVRRFKRGLAAQPFHHSKETTSNTNGYEKLTCNVGYLANLCHL